MPCSSPLDRPSENANTVERLMPMTFGLRSSITCLSACHCSSPQSSACRPPADGRRPAFVERRASNTPPCDVPPSAMRSTHAAARRASGRRALVEEHVDRPPPRGERLGRGDRRRTPGPRCTRASARPTCRCRACASAPAGTCRAASSATPAASPPARAACRTGDRPPAELRRRSVAGPEPLQRLENRRLRRRGRQGVQRSEAWVEHTEDGAIFSTPWLRVLLRSGSAVHWGSGSAVESY